MPRTKLSNVSLKQLVAEIERRRSRLSSLVAQRKAIEKEIDELQVLPGPAWRPTDASRANESQISRQRRAEGRENAALPGRPLTLAELRREIQIGVDQIERGECVTVETEEQLDQLFDDVIARGRRRLRKLVSA
jgi:hypothetical protein